jgi:hypothetical protein
MTGLAARAATTAYVSSRSDMSAVRTDRNSIRATAHGRASCSAHCRASKLSVVPVRAAVPFRV